MAFNSTYLCRLIESALLVAVVLSLVSCGESDKPAAQAPTKQVAELDPAAARVDAGAQNDSVRQDDWFEDVSNHTGIQFTFRTGKDAGRLSLLETLGGGVALFDFDADDDLDLICTSGGEIDAKTGVTRGLPLGCFRNDGTGRFTDASSLFDVKTEYSHGLAVGDFDRDGTRDVLVTCYGQSRLFRNQAGQRFADATLHANLKSHAWDTAAVLVDLTGDGFPELFIASYVDLDTRSPETCRIGPNGVADVCPPQHYPATRDRLYLNLGDGTFADVTQQAGLLEDGRGLGALAADVNLDGWPDLYVANDGDANQLYLGGAEWPLREVGVLSGVAFNEAGAAEGSMGVDYADVDGDGRGDIWVTNYELEDNSLYRSLGDGLFEHATVRMGLAGTSRAYVGFGTGLFDFNGDNRPDIHVLNGHVTYHRRQSPFLQPPFLYRNLEGRRFEDVSLQGGTFFRQRHAARGSAIGDIDGDGALDVVISRLDEPIVVLKNRQAQKNWGSIRLVPTSGDEQAVGASVSVRAFGRDTTSHLRLGTSFLSHSDVVTMFSLEPDQSTVDVTVRWSSGRTELFTGLTTRRIHRLSEETGRASTP